MTNIKFKFMFIYQIPYIQFFWIFRFKLIDKSHEPNPKSPWICLNMTAKSTICWNYLVGNLNLTHWSSNFTKGFYFKVEMSNKFLPYLISFIIHSIPILESNWFDLKYQNVLNISITNFVKTTAIKNFQVLEELGILYLG